MLPVMLPLMRHLSLYDASSELIAEQQHNNDTTLFSIFERQFALAIWQVTVLVESSCHQTQVQQRLELDAHECMYKAASNKENCRECSKRQWYNCLVCC